MLHIFNLFNKSIFIHFLNSFQKSSIHLLSQYKIAAQIQNYLLLTDSFLNY